MKKFSFKSDFPRPRRGFALVAVLLLAVLLTLIVVALFSLLNVETQSGGNVALRNEARQNALTGLSLALGELQKNMGPDQRISAPSSLEVTEANMALGKGQYFWTGVWKSYGTQPAVATPNTLPITIPPLITVPGRTPPAAPATDEGSFQRWLVSGNANSVKQWSYPNTFDTSSASTLTDTVVLVGDKSTGDKATMNVTVQKMPADSDPGKSSTDPSRKTGSYAWWVGDEGAKALVNIPKPAAPTVFSEILQGVATAARPSAEEIKIDLKQAGVPTTYDLSTLDSGSDKIKKIVTRGLIPLGLVSTTGTSFGSLNGLFHDVTPYSYGVLSDVKYGGLKKDLSLLFELSKTSPSFPSFLNTDTVFTPPPTTGNRISRSSPKWITLYNYYNLYKSPDLSKNNTTGEMIFNADNTNVTNPDSVLNTYLANFSPTTGDTIITTATITPEMRNYYTPVLYRAQFLFSFFKKPKNYLQADSPPEMPNIDKDVLFMSFTPLIYVWNPYNVTLKSTAINSGGDRKPDWKLQIPPFDISFDNGTTWRSLTDIFDATGGGLCTPFTTNNLDLTLKPGEVQVWGPNESGQKYIGANRPTIKKQGPPATSKSVTLQIKAYNVKPGWDKTVSFVSYALGPQTASNTYTYPPWTPATATPAPVSDYSILMSELAPIKIKIRYQRATPFQINEGIGTENNSANTMELYPTTAYPLNTTDFPDPDQSEFSTTISPSDIPSTPASPYYFFTFDFKRKLVPESVTTSKLGLFVDAAERSYNLDRPTVAGMQMAPFFFTAHGLTGDANAMSDGSGPVVPIEPTTNRGYLGPQSEGLQFRSHREFPIFPMSSLLQLRHVTGISSDYSHPISVAFSGRGVSKYKNSSNAQVQIAGMTPYVDPAAVFAFPVGNSFAHPKIPPNAVQDTERSLDQCFYFNEALADTYFFSTLTPQNAPSAIFASPKTVQAVFSQFQAGTTPLPNSRFDYFLPAKLKDADVTAKLFTGGSISSTAYNVSASCMMVRGAFNVNSTSVAAWEAILGSLRSQKVAYLTPATVTVTNVIGNIPILRWLLPNNKSRESATSANEKRQAVWNGFRDLTDAQIQLLAQKIVEQVKLRGPFRSVAEFLNRQISSQSPLNESGAVQAALDSLNTDPNGINKDIATPTAAAAAPTFPFPGAGAGPLNAGAPGYIMQADILNALAPTLSARSDTFVIRAYGDIMNNATDKRVLSRAWCEAIVQRVPDFIDPTQNAPEDPISSLSATNLKFGRRFKIVQFRWLSPDEI